MESIIRAAAVYLVIFILFRLSGKRTLANTTPFEMVMLLIISETTQEALVDGDYSLTNCFMLIITLLLIDQLLSFIKMRSKGVEKILDGVPMILVDKGNPLKDRMEKSRIGEDDILESAREAHGLENMQQIKYAVLEKNGSISIIPKEKK